MLKPEDWKSAHPTRLSVKWGKELKIPFTLVHRLKTKHAKEERKRRETTLCGETKETKEKRDAEGKIKEGQENRRGMCSVYNIRVWKLKMRWAGIWLRNPWRMGLGKYGNWYSKLCSLEHREGVKKYWEERPAWCDTPGHCVWRGCGGGVSIVQACEGGGFISHLFIGRVWKMIDWHLIPS